ncbi:hypothetical protein [Streptomyces sp. NBC_00691]|uniref:hypothetical protein n=1 Tax=Streptomyces sp. NBC_00691 TaxID=2903671 RepID=UPI002E3669D3|nr:hypothetical protein [Streptomyces sp. NBC_00691]
MRRVQSFDAARALADAPTPQAAAAQAAQWAAAAPHDLRLAVLAETTASLAETGRSWLPLLLRRGLEYRFATGVVVAGLIVLRITVLPAMPFGVAAGVGLLLGLPFLSLRRQLRAARERAAERMVAAVAAEASAGSEGFGAPELPPVPRVTPREYAFAGAGIALLLAVGVASYTSSLAHPRYDIVAHDTFQGLQGFDLREEFDPFAAMPDGELTDSTARLYIAEDAPADAAAEYLVAVTTGDFHEMRESYVYDGGLFPKETEEVGTIHDTWRAAAGPHGAWMQCLRFTEVASGTLRAMCVWGDKGSVGLTLFTAADKNRDAVEDTARSVGTDFLRPAAD